MKFNYFEKVSGIYIEEIRGQSRFGYSMSDTIDFYDMVNHTVNGDYPGVTISFYDYATGKVYMPFEKNNNILYGKPIYSKNLFWFLQFDYNYKKISLYKYFPNELLEKVTVLNSENIQLYNLRLVGEDVHIISDNNEVICYYPNHFQFDINDNESVQMIVDGKVYLAAWIEEGWDESNNCASEQYKYYEQVNVRNYDGDLLSSEVGCLKQRADGTWWIS